MTINFNRGDYTVKDDSESDDTSGTVVKEITVPSWVVRTAVGKAIGEEGIIHGLEHDGTSGYKIMVERDVE